MLLPDDIDFDGAFPRLSRRLRLGVVGGGRISQVQAMAARLSGHWEIVAGALSSDADKARRRGQDWYLPEERCYPDFQAMASAEAARSDGVDAVMITTPNDVHHAAASAFIAAGIDVICDKPLTNTLEDALSLVQQVDQQRIVFATCYTMSCFPMVRQAREIVQRGDLGRINQIHVEFLQDWMIPDDVAEAEHVRWRLDPARSGSTSCTGDIATHAAHLAGFVSDLPLTHLRAEMHVCGAPKPLEDTVMMLTRYADSVPGTLIATRLAAGNRGGLRLRVFGSQGGIEWDMEHAEYLRFNRYGEPDQTLSRGQGHGISNRVTRLTRTGRGFPEGLIEAWANLYTEFAMAVAARRDRRPLPAGWIQYPTLADGVAGVRFIEAAVASDRDGGSWVEIEQ